MSDPSTKLRVVGDGDRPGSRRRGPGLAVILVCLYGLAFAAALWVFRGQALKARPAAATGNAPAARPAVPRAAAGRPDLISGTDLEPGARSEYLRRIGADCCDCGCDLTLSRCLVGEQKCARSPEMAEERRRPFE